MDALQQLLLISNSTLYGSGYLDHAEAEILAFLAGRKRILFVPDAAHDRDATTTLARERFAAMGCDLVSVHAAGAAFEAADAVFVGGSLARRGGQNPIEAVRYGKPVVTGPHVFNFEAVYELLRSSGAALQVRDAASLAQAIARFLLDPARSRDLGRSGQRAIERARGATARNVAFVLSFVQEKQTVGFVEAGV